MPTCIKFYFSSGKHPLKAFAIIITINIISDVYIIQE